jgi:hypothetical protein
MTISASAADDIPTDIAAGPAQSWNPSATKDTGIENNVFITTSLHPLECTGTHFTINTYNPQNYLGEHAILLHQRHEHGTCTDHKQ